MISVKQLTSKYLDDLDNINSVLDLGCGSGRKSIRFARKGIMVTGVDKREIKITQDNFNFIQGDIKEFDFKKNYDLIITSLVLHFIKKEKAIEIIQKIQTNTESKGYSFIICMSNKDDCAKERPDNFYPTLEEIKELYPESEWEIEKSIQDFTDYEGHDNIPKHRHNLILLLAEKR